MKALIEQTHYEVLEIPRGATVDDVERAYSFARSAYAEGSVAMYSLFDDRELTEQRTRIERAYNVLSDETMRSEYDQTLEEDQQEAKQVPTFGMKPSLLASALSSSEAGSQLDGFVEFDDGEEDSAWDGSRLRRNRIGRGIELEDVAVMTKISSGMLRFIEDERFEDLPATVYLRGFLDAYSQCVGLDSGKVVPSYMERCEKARTENKSLWAGR